MASRTAAEDVYATSKTIQTVSSEEKRENLKGKDITNKGMK